MDGQTQDTQDACNSCVFLAHISSRKNENPLNRSQTQQEKRKIKRNDMKKDKI
jgi:hypothetical protein